MFSSGAVAADRPGRLRLGAALAREFGDHSPTAGDPDLRTFTADLVRPYRLPLDEAVLTGGLGHSYAELGEHLVAELTSPERPVDLLVLVFGSPDVQPVRTTAVHLSTRCPGRPLAFALCDQGAAGVFSALRIARAYAACGVVRRALVLVVEQAHLPYQPLRPAPWPDRHAGVGLLWETDGAGELDLPTEHGPSRQGELTDEQVDAELRGALAGLVEPVLLLGPGLAAVPAPAGVRSVRARPGAPFTGLWSELARRQAQWRASGRSVLLADRDPLLGYLSLAVWTPEQKTARPVVPHLQVVR
ncbi:2-hydroxy-acid oxidase [Kitasatospora viridis]|uniref:4-hydroxymandelate oxidase n=1 Tax=Kitasatospora viridis TaxID=281105 RepID=A0A561UPS3_9ACTN|nr:2-hydroxy-acid oxidase [Kitasatospora viridis]TWG01363.1 hypothetical protein FHX73_115256 [Kitasatospora viridis]